MAKEIVDSLKENSLKNEKLKAIHLVIDKLNKEYGKGSVIGLNEKVEKIDAISTGSLGLDVALGIGGVPKGRIIEIYGQESSGKTSLCTSIIAQAQKKGGICAIIDAEHAFDSCYAKKLGVVVEDLFISQPDNGEQALEIAEKLILSGGIDVIVVDSVAALVPRSEIEGEMGDSKMGLQARLMGQALRKLVSCINKTNTTCIFINQMREKIGVIYGSPYTTTGGNALKFYASVRMEIKKKEALKNGDVVYGNNTVVKVVKNKVAPPFKECSFDLIFGEGISKIGEIVDLGVESGIISKAGSWYSYKENKIGQGRDNTIQFFKDNVEMCEEIEKQILEKIEIIDK